jgi:Flp pilus assembly protein TadD
VRVAFFGNCQAQVLNGIYQRSVAPWNGAESIFIDAYTPLTEQSVAWLADTNLVVAQIIDGGSKTAIDRLPTTAERHLFPAVAAIFLWPFGYQAHPHNQSYWHLPSGPYAIQKGDGYLNRLINQGVDPAEAVKRYLEVDVGKQFDLDRLLEVSMDQQHKRDELTGYAFRDEIVDNFRTERLFITADHPNVPFGRRFAAKIMDGIGAGADALARISRYRQLFPIDELPIHPGVARHFGLSFLEPQQRYRFLREGSYTFEEYANRYARFEWNQELSEGIALASSQRPAEALAKLRAGLERSPHASAGHRLLASSLAALGDSGAAVESARRATTEDPNDPHAYGVLAHCLRHLGRSDEAEAAILTAIRLDPDSASTHLALVDLLKSQARLPEAVAAARKALDADPCNAVARAELALLLRHIGELGDAERELTRAIQLAPDQPDLAVALAEVQEERAKAQRKQAAGLRFWRRW